MKGILSPGITRIVKRRLSVPNGYYIMGDKRSRKARSDRVIWACLGVVPSILNGEQK